MRVVFLDRMEVDYNARTPYERPLGGSQSALCYLAAALVRRGHDVAMATHTTAPGRYEGVRCVGRNPGFTAEYLRKFDVVVVLNGAFGKRLRTAVPDARLVLWTQHAHDQPAMHPLLFIDEVEAWDRIVTLSEWQTKRYVDVFQIGRPKFTILRNAVSPAFERGPDPRRGDHPVLAYTSTPFRGLGPLLDAWPAIRAAHPTAVLRVYSSMQVYTAGAGGGAPDPHEDLYRRCRDTPGVEYVGSVPQPALADALAEADALAYPSIFGETSCIAVMEALAAGCRVYCTRTAALPETGAPYAQMVELDPRETLPERFAALVSAGLARRGPDEAARAREQAFAVRESASWSRRAADWEAFLADLVELSPRS